MTGTLREAFLAQATACADLDSPFMARLCRVMAERLTPDTPLSRRLFDWPGDLSPRGASVPLRLAGALHALVLRGDAALRAVYPPSTVPDDRLWRVLSEAMVREAAFIDRFIDSPPQTNEVRRSAALIAAGHWLAARHPLPFVLSELGASAGLNLNWDRFALDFGTRRYGPDDARVTLTPAWRGAPPPAPHPIRVAERAGVDLNPIDLRDRDQRLRLLSYLWADQPHRLALTEAAIAAAPPLPQRLDAIDWLDSRLAPRPGHLHLVWSTVAWQYIAPDAQRRGTRLIESAGARATPDSPLAWLSYESDGTEPGAALTLRLWPGGLTLALGRADFHGRWIAWNAP